MSHQDLVLNLFTGVGDMTNFDSPKTSAMISHIQKYFWLILTKITQFYKCYWLILSKSGQIQKVPIV